MSRFNTCPRPSAAKYQELLHATRRLMVEIETVNEGRITGRAAAMYAVDGMAEAWELAAPIESNLRSYFAALTVRS